MAENIALEAQPRTLTGKKVKQLRAEELIPGVIYGPKLEKAIPFQAPYRKLQDSLRAAGSTNLLEVTIEDEVHNVLVRDVQRDIIRGDLLHVDFYVVPLGQVFRTVVPIALVGEAEIVRSGFAQLITGSTTAVEVECLPSEIPDELTLDISQIVEIGEALTVADLAVPENVTILADPTEVLIRTDYAVAPEVEEEEEEELEEVFDAEGVEVVKRGKDEEEEEEENAF